MLSEEQKQELYSDIYDDSIWLINLVENLLSITRIDNGALHLNFQAELLEEVIAEALLHVNRNKEDHVIRVVLEEELLMARMDSRLIIQVIINLVDNAIKYSGSGSHITLSARQEQGLVVVEVADDGPGISPEAKSKVFEMFYTADNVREMAGAVWAWALRSANQLFMPMAGILKYKIMHRRERSSASPCWQRR